MSAYWRVATLAVASACVLLASGCGQPSGSDLHKAAESLVPPGATVLLRQDGDCVEGARFPSCVQVFFRLNHRRFVERMNLFIANARQHGWRADVGSQAGSEVIVKLRKGSYRGDAGFWLDRYYRPTRHCDPTSVNPPCAEAFQVQWKGGGVIKG